MREPPPDSPTCNTFAAFLAVAFLLPGSLPAAQLVLSWTDNSNNEFGFKIERGVDGSNFTPLATVGADVTTYVDEGLPVGTTYWYRVRAYNGAGDSSPSNAVSATTGTVLASNPGITIPADGEFHRSAFDTAEKGTFSVRFDATPSAQALSSVIGLSSGVASTFSDLAAIVRFNSSGTIDARDGSSYSADAAISYAAGVTYSFRMEVNVATHTYSVFVTAPGGVEQLIGSDFAFRTEQGEVTSLDSWSGWLDAAFTGASITVSAFELTSDASSARLINLSTRAMVNGGEPLIAGFVVSGSGTQRVLIRAIGNTLTDFGIPNPVGAPVISIVRNSTGETLLETDGGWETGGNATELVAAMGQTGAFQLEEGRGDAAVLVDLVPGLYSAVVRDASGVGGICLVETYVVDDGGAGKLINLSTRGFAAAGSDVMIAGLVVSGSEPKRLLIRGVGPALTGYGVDDAMADPQIAVYARNVVDPILTNDNWGDDGAASQVATIASTVGAFGLSPGSADAAVVVDLSPGIYTVRLSPASGNAGTGLVEVYAVD